MFLNSLNATRSYHESGHFIRFFGHDGLTEIAFKIDATALSATSHHEIEKLAVFRSLREKSTAWHKRFIRMGRCCSTL
jgi:Protein of unknown function (DUF1488)